MKLEVIVADAIDTLQSGKLAAIGIFPDRVVVLNIPVDAPVPSAEAPFALNLCVALNVTDIPKGKHDLNVEVTAPSGLTPLTKIRPKSQFRAKEGRSLTVVLPFTPFIIPEFGVYRLEVEVDGTRLSAGLEFRENRLGTS